MQAVILMAGRGSRMAKDHSGPKQLLLVGGKPIIHHTLDNLPDKIDELIFVVGGPHEEALREHFRSGVYNDKPITFVRQEVLQGVAHAYWSAREKIQGRFLGLLGDDIIGKEDLKNIVAEEECAVLARRVPNPQNFGVLVPDEEGYLRHAIEKPKEYVSDLVSTGVMVMDEDFFAITDIPLSTRGEYEVPDIWCALISQRNKKIRICESESWVPVNDAQELTRARETLGLGNELRAV